MVDDAPERPEPASPPSAIAVIPASEPAPQPAAPPVPETPDPLPEAEPALRVSTDRTVARRFAVWTATRIRLSDDDGRAFAPILEHEGEVFDVALDGTGRTWSVRGTQLGVRARDGTEHWLDLPTSIDSALWYEDGNGAAARPRLAANAKQIVIAVPHADPEILAIMLSRDHGGSTWTRTEVEATVQSSSIGIWRYEHLAIDPRGRITLWVAWGQGNDCGITYATLYRGTAHRGLRPIDEIPDGPMDLVWGHDQWAYGMCADAPLTSTPICRLAPPPSGSAIAPARAWDGLGIDAGDGEFTGVIGQNKTVAIAADRLIELEAGHTRELSNHVPAKTILRAVDRSGRVFAERDGTLVRYSAGSGWESIAAGP